MFFGLKLGMVGGFFSLLGVFWLEVEYGWWFLLFRLLGALLA